MIRPMTLIGMIVIFVAIFSFLTIPGWRGSAPGIGILIVCLVIGGLAIAKDLASLGKELKKPPKEAQGETEKPPQKD